MYHPSGSLDQKFVKNHCQQQSFFSICGTTTQKMWLQTDKLRIFQSLWLISDIHQFFYQFFRYQASQKFLFYNRYRLFFHGIHKEVSRIKKSICLLYLPLIFKRDRINIPSAKSEGLGCTPQCIKMHRKSLPQKAEMFSPSWSFPFPVPDRSRLPQKL